MTIQTVGLVLDAAGVLLLVSPFVTTSIKELGHQRTMTMLSQDQIDGVHRRAKIEMWCARPGFALLLAGFVLQIVGIHTGS